MSIFNSMMEPIKNGERSHDFKDFSLKLFTNEADKIYFHSLLSDDPLFAKLRQVNVNFLKTFIELCQKIELIPKIFGFELRIPFNEDEQNKFLMRIIKKVSLNKQIRSIRLTLNLCLPRDARNGRTIREFTDFFFTNFLKKQVDISFEANPETIKFDTTPLVSCFNNILNCLPSEIPEISELIFIDKCSYKDCKSIRIVMKF